MHSLCFYLFIPVMDVWEHTGLCYNLCSWKLNSYVHGGCASFTHAHTHAHTQHLACSLLGWLCSLHGLWLAMPHLFKGAQTTCLRGLRFCVCSLQKQMNVTRLALYFVLIFLAVKGHRELRGTLSIYCGHFHCCCVELNNSCVITWWLVAQLLNQGRNMTAEGALTSFSSYNKGTEV